MNELTDQQARKLKKMAHDLKPLVQVGKGGMSDGLVAAVDRALSDHELIKVKLLEFKNMRDELSRELSKKTGSLLIDRVGNTAILFRQNEDPVKRIISL